MTINRGGTSPNLAYLSRFPSGPLIFFCHPEVISALGTEMLIDVLYRALHDGRVRIHDEHCDYSVSLIGMQRAI